MKLRNNASIERGLKEKIFALGKKDLTYDEIKEKLGCSKSTIAYHLSEGQKEKAKARIKRQRDKDIRYDYDIQYKETDWRHVLNAKLTHEDRIKLLETKKRAEKRKRLTQSQNI
tara:strand:+ start:343 stop:684 length:342 start_codon:yes stop_codon:yes gene_type:complete